MARCDRFRLRGKKADAKVRGACHAQSQADPAQDYSTIDIPIKDGKWTYTFTFARVTLEEWCAFVDETRRSTEEKLLALGQKKLLKVDGYSGDIMSKPQWQERIWPRHMIPAVMALMDAVDAKRKLAAQREALRADIQQRGAD